MSTILFIGKQSATLTSLAGIARSIGGHVFEVADSRAYGGAIRIDLIVIEYQPQEVSSEHFMGVLGTLHATPLIVVGPDLPASRVNALLQPHPHSVYLRVSSSLAERREALRLQLPQKHQATLKVGALQLNVSSGVVRYGPKALSLTSTEFKLLQGLMKQPGRTIECSALEVLGQCLDVPTHVGNLRRKLLGCSAPPLLRGNRQLGYAIDARHHPRTQRNAGFALRNHLLHLI